MNRYGSDDRAGRPRRYDYDMRFRRGLTPRVDRGRLDERWESASHGLGRGDYGGGAWSEYLQRDRPRPRYDAHLRYDLTYRAYRPRSGGRMGQDYDGGFGERIRRRWFGFRRDAGDWLGRGDRW